MITSIIILAIAAMVLAATQSTMFIYIMMHKAQKNKCIKVKHKSAKPKANMAKENVEEVATKEEKATDLSQHEKELVEKITDSLKRHNGNMKQAAKFIGMPYPTFYYYVKKHSIKGVVLDRNSERKLARINDYCKLRKNGTILADAAKAIGISMQTAYAYEVIFNNKK
jgi:hypothetical protein